MDVDPAEFWRRGIADNFFHMNLLSMRAWGNVDLILDTLVNASRNMRAQTPYAPIYDARRRDQANDDASYNDPYVIKTTTIA